MIKLLTIAGIVGMIIAIIMKMIPEAMLFLVMLISLRQNAGGYHTRHRITCDIMSTIIYHFFV